MKQILFVGNSFTYFNDMPYLFSFLANRAGFENYTGSVVLGGWWLNRYADPDDRMGRVLREEYPKRDWDYIIWQDQSFNPAGDPADFLAAARALRTLCPCKKQVYYQTWAYEDGTEKLADTGMTYQQMRDALRASYRQAAEECGGICVPVGDAFSLCRDTHSEIGLYNPDHYHPSLAGSYLAACLFYACLSGQSPLRLGTPEGLNENTAAVLREIAHAA